MFKSLFSAGLLLTITSTVVAQTNNRELSFSAKCADADTSAVISFNGDILVHHSLYKAIFPSKSFSSLWRDSEILIRKADFSVANLEGPAAEGITASGEDKGKVGWIYDARYYGNGKKDPEYDKNVVYSGTNFTFNFHPRILSDLMSSGWDLLTLANNHSLDRKSIGIERTLEAAKEAKIQTSGVRMRNDNRESDFYNISIINDMMIAFISCTEDTNGKLEDKIEKNKEPRYNQVLRCSRDPEQISKIIESLLPSVDAVVVLPHWGSEYSEEENSKQQIYGRAWIQAGALAVIGSHPHVIQPWEKYEAKDDRGNIKHEGLIIYSLGNFVAGQGVDDSYKSDLKKTGITAYLGLSKRGNRTEISAVGYTPTHRTGARMIPVSHMTGNVARNVIPKFGSSNFISPQAPLGRRFCK